MPAGIADDVYEFVKEIVFRLLPSEKDSEDVTYYMFKMIDSRPSILAKYQKLVEEKEIDTVHKQMGKAVKHLEERENLEENHNPKALTNIRLTSYTRFKPKA